jgi:hypothetical protein
VLSETVEVLGSETTKGIGLNRLLIGKHHLIYSKKVSLQFFQMGGFPVAQILKNTTQILIRLPQLLFF